LQPSIQIKINSNQNLPSPHHQSSLALPKTEKKKIAAIKLEPVLNINTQPATKAAANKEQNCPEIKKEIPAMGFAQFLRRFNLAAPSLLPCLTAMKNPQSPATFEAWLLSPCSLAARRKLKKKIEERSRLRGLREKNKREMRPHQKGNQNRPGQIVKDKGAFWANQERNAAEK
jgi:hypothetical protein